MFHGHLECFQNPPLGGRPNTKPGYHGTLNAHNCWFILFYNAWDTCMNRNSLNSIWLRARSHVTSHYPWGSVTNTTWIWRWQGVLGRPLETFFSVLTISMVTALGSCVQWPKVPLKWPVMFPKAWWTSTAYFPNSTGPSVTSGRFSPVHLYMCGIHAFF